MYARVAPLQDRAAVGSPAASKKRSPGRRRFIIDFESQKPSCKKDNIQKLSNPDVEYIPRGTEDSRRRGAIQSAFSISSEILLLVDDHSRT